MTIEGLYFSYKHFCVFSDFNHASDARVVVLKGPSGCGKTTLLKLISKVLKPDSVRKFDVCDSSCLIIQEDSLLPWLTGLENLQKILKISYEQIASHPMYALVERYSSQRAFSMSYGQRRMLELFRAVLYRPPLLCLDEPFNFLDLASRQAITKHLSAPDLRETRIVLSTHHNDQVDELEGETFLFDGRFPVRSLVKT